MDAELWSFQVFASELRTPNGPYLGADGKTYMPSSWPGTFTGLGGFGGGFCLPHLFRYAGQHVVAGDIGLKLDTCFWNAIYETLKKRGLSTALLNLSGLVVE